VFAHSEQAEMLRLAVDVYQPPPNRFQQSQANHASVNAAQVSALAANFSGQYDEPRVVDELLLFKQRFHLDQVAWLNLKDSFNQRQVGALTKHCCVCPSTEQQLNRINDDGFPRPCLTGKHGETWPQIKLQVFNDGEIGDAQLGQHLDANAPQSIEQGPDHQRSVGQRPEQTRSRTHKQAGVKSPRPKDHE